jgi:hypothetical protein
MAAMNRLRHPAVLACAALLAGASSGCGSAAPAPADAGPADAGPADSAAADVARADAAADRAEAASDAVWRSGVALPAGVAPPRRILDGRWKLTGGGTNSCSHQEPASGDGDRWCAFSVAGAGGAAELWVIDVSQVAAGRAPRCDGTDPGCLRLTEQLWTAFSIYGPAHPYSHAFEGDTLIFYVGAAAKPDSVYRGTVYAWRPGWPRARAITSEKALLCYGHLRVPVAFCIEDVVGTAEHPDSFEVHAGSIADPAGGPLPAVGRVHPFLSTGGDAAWGWGFSRAGDWLAISSPDPDPAVQSIRAIATAEIGQKAPAEIVRDAASWTISNDGRRLYFTRARGAGKALLTAEFPGGAGPTELAGDVDDYLLLGTGANDQGLGVLSRVSGGRLTFSLLAAPGGAAHAIFTGSDMLEGLSVSSDLRYTGWVSAMFQARVVRNADLDSCMLNSEPWRASYSPRFLDGAALVVWEEDGEEDNTRRDAFYGRPDCQGRTRFAQGLDFLHVIGDRAVIYGDEQDARYAVTLKYAPITGGADWPAAPVRVHERVRTDKGVILLGSKPLLMVFEVGAGDPGSEGTYVFGPAPF